MNGRARTGGALSSIGVVWLLAGCSVAPPPPAHEDPALQGVGLSAAPGRLALSVSVSAAGRPAPTWAVAPVESASESRLEGADVAALDTAAPPIARAPVTPLSLPEREYASEAWPIAPDAVLAGLVDGLRSAGADALGVSGGSAEALLTSADAADAPLLLHVDLRQVRAAWVERAGVWWFDAVMFWVPGIYPIWFVPDEVYEVSLLARAQLVDVASGQVVAERDLIARAEDTLNNPQRGWSPGGMLFLHPWTLDEDDFQDVFEGLLPHAQRDLEVQLASWLGRVLPESEEQRRALRAQSGRTLALVIGAPGPSLAGALDRPPPLRGALNDAQAVAALLRETGQLARGGEPLIALVGEAARRAQVLEAARALAARARAGDQLLVYYAGFGQFDARGQAALLLDGDALPLAELAAVLPDQVRVTWLLDTSFAGAGGRTWPGAPVPDPAAALIPIRRQGWDGILAAAPGQAALESGDRPGGAFTTWLISGARGPADEDGDGEVSLGEMTGYLGRWMTPEVRERQGALQSPVRLSGGEASARLVRVPVGAGDEEQKK